ncbi:hypothetical protein HB779_22965 (plasmid) [Phyllobacterium sp. 628]|uniref:acyl-CoA dehydrogenase family protein n=1 Tax=Phyllobacterium sp. 628 TaxID=2718938 RepID=UPI0016626DB8|nr:acyl-CoA dehydrogenase family protein [Phyllobacterium sp. 628]QND54771.1 hypothetical protein HB779_22965 [Phyllobacterium sp. 628]
MHSNILPSLEKKADRTEFSVLIDRVRELKPILSASARETENNRRVSQTTMKLLIDAELTRMLRPAAFGGFEYGPSELSLIAYELGQACGSTAWCGALAIAYPWLVSHFSLEAQRDVLSDPDCVLASSLFPSKCVEIVPGGIKIAGLWRNASNCDNSQWLILGTLVPQSVGNPEFMWALVPTAQTTIDQDSWLTCGLQGTGSKTVRIDAPIFVPDYRLLRFADITTGTAPGRLLHGNRMSLYQFTTFIAVALASPILGMAQGALDAFVQTSQTRTRFAPTFTILPLAGSPIIQATIGTASAMIESALALLHNSLVAAEEKIRLGIALEPKERIALRRNQSFAARQSISVVNDLFSKQGASGNDLAGPVQRFWRDANAGALHIYLDWDAVGAMYDNKGLVCHR